MFSVIWANLSPLMRNSRVRSMTCLTLLPPSSVYLPECVMHWGLSSCGLRTEREAGESGPVLMDGWSLG